MNMQDLSALGAGFGDPSLGSQTVFRAALHALAHPGECVEVAHDAETPSRAHSASAALLLALLDSDCKLWLSPSLAASDASNWLRFHTGCAIVEDCGRANFVWIAKTDELPTLSAFAQGSDLYPDQSATCVIDVVALDDDEHAHGWQLSGPGIRTQSALVVEGLPDRFVDEWQENCARFPRGIDVFLAAADRIVGLPRTTVISAFAEQEQ